MKITHADLQWIKPLAILFNNYRIFYSQESDLKKSEEFLTERVRNKESIILICTSDNEQQIFGFIQLYPIFSSVSCSKDFVLNDLYVLPDFRNLGVATFLLEASKSYVIENKGKGLALETATDNPAKAIYEKLGWKLDASFLHYYWSNPKGII
jgi:ribosomal protein S18 acetylase RimI-like enzyme